MALITRKFFRNMKAANGYAKRFGAEIVGFEPTPAGCVIAQVEFKNADIMVDGRAFKVTSRIGENVSALQGKVAYELEGLKGARYFTIRNANQPELMFLVSANTMNVLDNVWLTDKSGALEVVR